MTMGQYVEVRSIEQLIDISACHAVLMELRPHLKIPIRSFDKLCVNVNRDFVCQQRGVTVD